MAASQTGTYNYTPGGAYNGVGPGGVLTSDGVPITMATDPSGITGDGTDAPAPNPGGGSSSTTSSIASLINSLAPLLGLGGNIGASVLDSQHLNDAIAYLKSIGGIAQGTQAASNQFGLNAYGNQNNQINPIFDGTNPYMQMLGPNGMVGNLRGLNDMLPGLTTGAGNLIYQDPTMAAYLGLSTRPTDFLTGQASAAGNIVGSGGQTANNSYISGRSQQLSSMNPLLSTGQAASMALDQAGTANANAAQTARAQAMNRGGGAGTVAGAGAANGGLADFSDAALRNTSNTLQQALAGQQGLNLQQVLGGLNAAQGGSALQQSLLNTGFSQGLQNALGASGLSQTALNQLLAGRTGASGIGQALAQLYQGQNEQLLGTANGGLDAILKAAGLSGNQGNAFLQNAAQALSSLGGTGYSTSNLLRDSPYSKLLASLGGLGSGAGASGASGGGSGLGGILGPIINAAGSVWRKLGGVFQTGGPGTGSALTGGPGNIGGGFNDNLMTT